MLAALAASEQKLAESTQWLEMMGLSWESDQSRYSSLSSGETGTLQKIVKTQTKADSQARWKI